MDARSHRPPLVAAVEMGYGHLRAAHALAEAWGVEVARADRAPYARRWERSIWFLARHFYEELSRGSQAPVRGALMRPLLDAVTRIGPPGGSADPTHPTLPARHLRTLVARGLGHGVVEAARTRDRPLVTTFFVPALAAQRLGAGRTWCLVTDTDASRAWVPAASEATAVTYLAPCREVVERLRAYGVPHDRIEETGFPLPPELLGGPDLPALRDDLAARLRRLDPAGVFVGPRRRAIEERLGPLPIQAPEPPLLTYAVGGAGAQAGLARRILSGLRPALREGRLRLCLVAGTRTRLAARFEEWIDAAGLSGSAGAGPVGAGGHRPVEVLAEPDPDAYFRRFHRLLARTDVLWTKPSELTFFGALGLPLLLAPPVGAQERANRSWAERAGVALPAAALPSGPEGLAGALARLAGDGVLAAAAWAGFRNLPQRGLYRISELVLGEDAERPGLSPRTPRAPASRALSSRRAGRP